MSSSASTQPLRRAWAPFLLPVVAAGLISAAIAALSATIPSEYLAVLVVGGVMVTLIRLAPVTTIMLMCLLRSALEGLHLVSFVTAKGIGLSAPDIAAIAFLIGGSWWLVGRILAGTFDWDVPTLLPVLLLLAIATISLSQSTNVPLGARDIAKFASAYCAYLVIMNARPDARALRLMLMLLVASAVVPIALSWYQFTHGIGDPGTFRGGLRVEGTFDHPNSYGFYLVSILAAVWGLWNAISRRGRLWVGGIGIAAFISIFMTVSRNAWGALALLVVVVGWQRRRVLLGAGAALGGVLLAMPRLLIAVVELLNPRTGASRGNSLTGRLDLWGRALATWKENPVLGNGWGSTKLETDSLAHNDYVRALNEGGLLGVGAFVLLIGSLVRASWRAAVGRTDLPRAFFGLSLGYMFVGFASNNFGKGAFQFYFWGLAGVSYLWAQTIPEVERPPLTRKEPELSPSR